MIVGPIQFDAPHYLALAPILWALAWLIARKSLSGLGRVTRHAALVARALLILLIAVALADPQWRREAEDVAVIVVTDTSRSMPGADTQNLVEYLKSATSGAERTDRMGVVTAAEQAYVQARPLDRKEPFRVAEEMRPGDWFTGNSNGTDLQSAVETGIALLQDDAAGRIVLHSDGNETDGSLLAAASAAKAAGIPIDVVPLTYRIEREVVFERLIAPATGRRGQTIDLRMVLEATEATTGRLTVTQNGQAIDLNGDDDGVSSIESLDQGRNVLRIPITLTTTGPQEFEAIYEPLEPDGDFIRENNRAMEVTFVSGAGRILAYADDQSAFEPLRQTLAESGNDVEVRSTANTHNSIIELQRYDAVILYDVPSFRFSQTQMDELASYVHDSGGGLVMVGGPNSFGAGGWIDTPVADVLPILLDPPDKRQLPRGALALIMHSCEMPNGTYWGKQVAISAINNLSRLDLVGVVEWNYTSGAYWPFPMGLKGDGTAAIKAVNGLTFGDMPDFAPTMQAAYDALVDADAGQRHAIITSDGDPQPPSQALLQKFIDAEITISTVAVFPHTGGFGGGGTMKLIAEATGGSYYFINTNAALAQLPSIFIKEAQVIRRSMIWEGNAVTPQIVNGAVPAMRGLGATLPPVSGYVVTAEREGLAQTTSKAPNGDPIVAQWQHGLGRAVAFTSDATSRWSSSWIGWSGFEAFWDQHIRWAMRPTGSANVSIATESRGDRTNVIVTALDAAGETLNFADFQGRLVSSNKDSRELNLRQTGPGRYEASFDSADAGTYMLALQYESRNDAGEVTDRGFVNSAVTRPFADEHRSIEDNTPLLVQVAELTGGRVIDRTNAASIDLFDRAGLVMPVSLRPVWLVFAVIAIGVFLVDVAVRRVRLDIPAMFAAVRRLGMKTKEKSLEQVGSLKEARAKTQAGFAERGSGSMAERKYDAADDLPAKKVETSSIVDTPGGSNNAPIVDATKKSSESGSKGDAESGEEAGMSRLLKAKRRAQQEYKNDEDEPS
ncbi:MAG: glutamine amidotransferase [Phycisphaerales bacterium]